MKIEVISIGDELLIGQTVNTNAAWIGEQLINIGAQLQWVTTVGDSAERLKEALEIAESRCDVVLLTGGLGPTHDDVTKNIVCDYFDSRLVLNEEVLELIKERFRKRGFEMAKVNEEQAEVPHNADIMKNELGTAPGMIFRRNNKTVFVMPGVPREMKAMMRNYVLPEIKTNLNGQVVLVKNFMTTSVPESTLYEQINNLKEIEKEAQIAFLPNLYGVKLRLMVSADSEEKAQEKLSRAETMLREKIQASIYSEGEVALEETLAKLLTERGETLAIAESCTGGLVSNKLTNIPGSSNFFDRSVISYSNAAKIDMLGVPQQLIEQHGAVSEQVAKSMAEKVREISGTTYGLSITGIAGPSGGTPEKPVGLVYVGYADESGTLVERHTFANDRIGNKERSVQAVLNLLRKKIIERNNG